jgi:hypothetical protein
MSYVLHMDKSCTPQLFTQLKLIARLANNIARHSEQDQVLATASKVARLASKWFWEFQRACFARRREQTHSPRE